MLKLKLPLFGQAFALIKNRQALNVPSRWYPRYGSCQITSEDPRDDFLQ